MTKKFASFVTLLTVLIAVASFGFVAKNIFAQEQESVSVLYVPLIGITAVPSPLALPNGPGEVTYSYAVKNLLHEVSLTDIQVADDSCAPVMFLEGDDDNDAWLDSNETWRFRCTTALSVTSQSTATVKGTAFGITTTDNAFATVIVGTDTPPPLVSIVNITKVAAPLSLPAEGGDIDFTYKVNNPGIVPLDNVTVADDTCGAMSGKVGDTNNNELLDVHEVWIYTCTSHLTKTTTNVAKVTAYANGFKAVDTFSLMVTVAVPNAEAVAPAPTNFPDTGLSATTKFTIWGLLLGVVIVLVFLAASPHAHRQHTQHRHIEFRQKLLYIALGFAAAVSIGAMSIGLFLLFPREPEQETETPPAATRDALFGWQYPVADFPTVGPTDDQLAYSDIRDPGGIPQGLPVRLKIPAIGVNSAIEDALITPEGRMDVPEGSVNVAWFALGPHPGQEGSAVIGGHYGIQNGVPFVFYKLDQLTVGDLVYVIDDNGATLTFVVTRTALFDRNADATSVFTSNDGLAHLNLITCEGIWNQVNDSYPDRRVVFTTAVAPEGAELTNPTLPSTATDTETPTVVPDVVTTPEPSSAPTATDEPTPEPIAPEVEVETVPEPSAAAPVVVRTAKGLYATPIDALVTTLLLAAIMFLGFKVAKTKAPMFRKFQLHK